MSPPFPIQKYAPADTTFEFKQYSYGLLDAFLSDLATQEAGSVVMFQGNKTINSAMEDRSVWGS